MANDVTFSADGKTSVGGRFNSDGGRLLLSSNFESALAEEDPGFNLPLTNAALGEDVTDASNQVAIFTFEGSVDSNAQAQINFSLGAVHRELWIKYRLYVPSNWDHRVSPNPSGNGKGYFQLKSPEPEGQSNLVGMSWWREGDGLTRNDLNAKHNSQTSTHQSTDSDGRNPIMAIDTPDLDAWQTFACQVLIPEREATNGRVRAWKNGSIMFDYRNEAIGAAAGTDYNGLSRGYILGTMNAGFDETTVMQVDDLWIGTTAQSINFTVPE